MTDKVQKIREEVERLKRWNNNVRNSTRHMTLQEEDFNRGKHSSYLEILNFIDSLQKEPVSSIWHDTSEMPKEKNACLIRYSANDGASTNNFEVVIAEPLTRRFVTRPYPHKTGYQHTIHGETTIKVDEYQDRREKIPFSDIDGWAYIDDLLNIKL